MRPRRLVVCVALLVLGSAGSVAVVRSANAATSTLAVVGNHFVDNGNVVVLRGVNRSGSEYMCTSGGGLTFDGPSDDASIAAMASWNINVVRVPLNEDCWLGINGYPASMTSATYQQAIAGYVNRLHSHGLYAILDLHWNAPGTQQSSGQQVMADADHSPAFWTSVATTFKADPQVVFDLYNEPHDISWACLRDGCLSGFQTAGMQSLVNAVRATGATHPILAGGLAYSNDLSQWLSFRPSDSQLAASLHTYNFNSCATQSCWTITVLPVAISVPVVAGELGEDDCAHGYIDGFMNWADSNGVGYLGWAWNTYDCGGFPSLISNYDGTPTNFGLGFKNHLAALPALPTIASVTPNRGLSGGGTTVTIAGTNFTGATAVKFGATAATSFSVVSDTQMTAVSPAHAAGIVDVTVTRAAGTSAAVLADQFVYLPPPVAVFPAMADGAYGGYLTASTIQNIGTGPAFVHINYYDQNGSPIGAGDTISNLAVNASWTVRQDNGNSFPSAGGNVTQAGSAVVYSSQPVASFVNEFAPGNAGDATSYTGLPLPSGVGTTLYAPTIVNNAFGAYTTGIGLLSAGSSPTNVTVTYRDGVGAVVATQTVNNLGPNSYLGLYSGNSGSATDANLPSGFAGTATITSSGGQPVGAIVNEVGPGGQFSSYAAVPSGSAALNAPVALNNAFGGYYTGMGIQNTSGSAGNFTVTYYDASGTPTVRSFSIAANGSVSVYQGSATVGPPAVGAYTAVIQSSNVTLAAIVNEVVATTASAKQSTSYNTSGAGSGTIHLALVENAGTDPWNTGEGIMNTGSAGTTVTVTYFNAATGAAVGTAQTLTLAPHAFWGLFQPSGGLPAGTRATAVVTTSPGGQVAVICNESSSTTLMSYDGQ